MSAFILNSIKKTYSIIIPLNDFEIRQVTNRSTVAIPEIPQVEFSNPVFQIESPPHIQENIPQILIVAPAPDHNDEYA